MTKNTVPVANNFEFHHLGYATTNIKEACGFFGNLNYALEDEEFEDPIQGIRGLFMVGGGPRIELLENLDGSETLTPWLGPGPTFYHTAYLVDDIESAIDWVRGQRARIVVSPVEAVAFSGRKIAFAMFRNRYFIELISKK